MPTYSEIKLELIEISKIITTYPENIQSNVYELLISSYLDDEVPPKIKSNKTKNNNTRTEKQTTIKNKATKKKSSLGKKQSYSIVKDLNLRGNGGQTFNEFVEEKNPSSAIEFNSVSVYYLKQVIKLKNVTINHINTCYKEAKRKPPGDLLQSIRDTSSNKYGYIDFSDSADIKIPHRGESFVEHDLPKSKKK